MDRFPLGACEITFDAVTRGAEHDVHIDITIKDEDVVFATEDAVYGVSVDQLDGFYIANHIAGENPASLTASAFIIGSDLPNLSSAYVFNATKTAVAYMPNGKEVLYGKLTIHPISAGSSTEHDIVGEKVSCMINLNANFKAEETSRADLVFNFSADDDPNSETFRAIFTLGDFKTV